MPDYPVVKHPNFEKQYTKYSKHFAINRLDEIITGLEVTLMKLPTKGILHREIEGNQMFSSQPYNPLDKMNYRIVWFFNGETVQLYDIYPLTDE